MQVSSLKAEVQGHKAEVVAVQQALEAANTSHAQVPLPATLTLVPDCRLLSHAQHSSHLRL